MRHTQLEKCKHLVELIKSEDFYNDYTGTPGNQNSKEALFDRIVRINLGVEEGKIAMENFNYVLGMKKINIENAPVNYKNAWASDVFGGNSDEEDSDRSSIPDNDRIVRNAARNRLARNSSSIGSVNEAPNIMPKRGVSNSGTSEDSACDDEDD